MAVKPYPSDTREPKEKPEPSNYEEEFIQRTSGGHTYITGNEKGKEYTAYIHPSGTYDATFPDGSKVSFNQGKTVFYGKSGIQVSSDENYDLKVAGHGSMKVSGGMHIEVVGDAGIAVGGDVALVASKGFGVHAENMYFGARGNVNFNVGGDMKMQSGGNMSQNAKGNMSMAAKGSTTIASDSSTTITGSSISHNGPGDPDGSTQFASYDDDSSVV